MAEKPRRRKRLYERLLEEGEEQRQAAARARKLEEATARARKLEEATLWELEERAPEDAPRYIPDLRVLYSLIRSGGPNTWASSMWFDFLRGQYPGEYEMLKEEYLGKGNALQEGFRHGRAYARQELEEVNANEYLVFCSAPHDSFWHEADVLLIAAAREVEKGELTPVAARKVLEPYREVLSLIYGDMQKMIFDPARTDWLKEDSFPRADEVRRNRPASAIFWYESDDLNIHGVGLTTWATPHPIFEVMNTRALRTLRKAVTGKYKLVVKNDVDDYAGPSLGIREAIDLLDRETISEGKSKDKRAL